MRWLTRSESLIFVLGIATGAAGFAVIAAIGSTETGRFLKEVYVRGVGLWIATFYAAPVVSGLLRLAKVSRPTLSPTEQAVGRTIGYIERFLTFCFVLDEADNAIAMLVTAKGIYRLHEWGSERPGDASVGPVQPQSGAMETKETKASYTMIGTFASIAYAVSIALITRRFLGVIQ